MDKVNIIEQELCNDACLYDEGMDQVSIFQDDRFIIIDKQGAPELIKVLQEWIDNA